MCPVLSYARPCKFLNRPWYTRAAFRKILQSGRAACFVNLVLVVVIKRGMQVDEVDA